MTTILAVKKDNQVAIAGDGQVTMGENVIMKQNSAAFMMPQISMWRLMLNCLIPSHSFPRVEMGNVIGRNALNFS